jgi:transcriptional regulator NrdR family protein
MNCSKCDHPIKRGTSSVLQSRRDTIESKIRQRKCFNCGHKFWTCETELPPNSVKWVNNLDIYTSHSTIPIRVPGARRVTYS